jgi:hypothetical protein
VPDAVQGFARKEFGRDGVRLSYMGGHTAILTAASSPELVGRLVPLEATVAGGTDPKRLGDWFRSWPLPFRADVMDDTAEWAAVLRRVLDAQAGTVNFLLVLRRPQPLAGGRI